MLILTQHIDEENLKNINKAIRINKSLQQKLLIQLNRINIQLQKNKEMMVN